MDLNEKHPLLTRAGPSVFSIDSLIGAVSPLQARSAPGFLPNGYMLPPAGLLGTLPPMPGIPPGAFHPGLWELASRGTPNTDIATTTSHQMTGHGAQDALLSLPRFYGAVTAGQARSTPGDRPRPTSTPPRSAQQGFRPYNPSRSHPAVSGIQTKQGPLSSGHLGGRGGKGQPDTSGITGSSFHPLGLNAWSEKDDIKCRNSAPESRTDMQEQCIGVSGSEDRHSQDPESSRRSESSGYHRYSRPNESYSSSPRRYSGELHASL